MQAIGKFLRIVWMSLDALRKVLHLLLLLFVFGLLLALLVPHLPTVPATAVLVIDPQGPLVEQTTGGAVDRAVAEVYGRAQTETLLRDVVEAINQAKDDDRIAALLLDLGDMTGGGLAKLQEVANAIKEFRATGKPVIAAGQNYDQSQYYLAAHADEIYLDPDGIVFIDGFG